MVIIKHGNEGQPIGVKSCPNETWKVITWEWEIDTNSIHGRYAIGIYFLVSISAD